MKIFVYILLASLLLCGLIDFSHCETSKLLSRSSILPPVKEEASAAGFWKTRTEWKAYWVRDWVVKKTYVPIWKRVWGPTQVKEWVPTGVAKPLPGWKQRKITR